MLLGNYTVLIASYIVYIDALVKNYRHSVVLEMALLQSCTKPSICTWE